MLLSVLRQNLKAGITYLMDRGYNDYKLFHTIKEAEAHFVTRLLKSASYTLIHQERVSPDEQQLGVVSDQWIRFDHSDPVMWVRKVEWRNANGTLFTYLTSRADIEPYLVVRLYQSRWLIERFFAWIKAYLQLKQWYSENENGVLIQLYAALIVFILLKMFFVAGWQRGQYKMSKEFVNWVQRHLFGYISASQISFYLHSLGFANKYYCYLIIL